MSLLGNGFARATGPNLAESVDQFTNVQKGVVLLLMAVLCLVGCEQGNPTGSGDDTNAVLATSSNCEPKPPVSGFRSGDQALAVILVEIETDDRSETMPWLNFTTEITDPKGFVEDFLLNGSESIDAFLDETSWGAMELTSSSRVDGPFLLPNGPTESDTCEDLLGYGEAAMAAACSSGVDLSVIDIVAVVFPPHGCALGGEAPNLANNQVFIYAWDSPIVYLHELSHAFGLDHAGNDFVDPLGAGWIGAIGQYRLPMHYSAFHKEQMGWVSGKEEISFPSDATVRLKAIERPPGVNKHLATFSFDSNAHHIHYRYPTGFDGDADGLNVLDLAYNAQATEVQWFGPPSGRVGQFHHSIGNSIQDVLNFGERIVLHDSTEVVELEVTKAGAVVGDIRVCGGEVTNPLTLTPTTFYSQGLNGIDLNASYSVELSNNAMCNAEFNPVSASTQLYIQLLEQTSAPYIVEYGVTENATFGVLVSGSPQEGVYGFTLTAEWVELGELYTVAGSYVVDRSSPSAPGLSAPDVTTGSVALSWTASQDVYSPIQNYRVKRTHNGLTVSWDVDGGVVEYEDTSVSSGETYSYTIVGIDMAGNESVDSNSQSTGIVP